MRACSLDAARLTSLGLAKPLMIAVCVPSQPSLPGFRLFRGGASKVSASGLLTLGANRRGNRRQTRLVPTSRELLHAPARICEAVETSKIAGPSQAKKTRSAGVRYARYRFSKRLLLSCVA